MPLRPIISGFVNVPSGSGGGAVLQVVAVTPKTDTASGSNSPPTWAVAYSGSITPTSTTSQIIAACFASIGLTTGYQAFARIQKGGVPILQGDAAGDRIQSLVGVRTEGSTRTIVSNSLVVSDAPGSTSPQTYDLALAIEAGGTWYLNRSQDDNDAAYIARCATTMFLIEIA